MKRSILPFTLPFLLMAAICTAQPAEKWTTTLSGDLAWHKVTIMGSYLVATSNGLYAYDQENGELLWENKEYLELNEDDVMELQGSTLLIARHGNDISIIDPYNGAVRFNTAGEGLAQLNEQVFLPRTNGIFIAGSAADGTPAILLVDNNTGTVRWRSNEKFGRIVSVSEISSEEFVLTTLFKIYKFNSGNGSVIWEEHTSQENAQLQNSALGGLLQGMAEEMSKDMDLVIRDHKDLDRGVLVLASEVKRETSTGNGGVNVSYTNNYNAYRLSDGSAIWDRPVEMQGRLGDLAFYGDGVIIMPDDGNRTKINYYPFTADAQGTWGKKGNGTVIKGGVYDHLPTGNDLLLVTGSGSNTFLHLLDPATGELRFEKPVKVSGQLRRTYPSEKGIAYVTTEEFNILDPASGTQLLKSSIPTTPELTIADGDRLYTFDRKAGLLRSIHTGTGAVSDINTTKLKFEGREEPTDLEKRDGGLLLTSDQNLVLLDQQGNEVYRRYYKAPRESGLKRALLMAQAVRAAYIGANAYAAAGVLHAAKDDVKEDDPVAGAVVEGFGMAYEELGDQASDFAKRSFQQARARFSATSQGRDFNIILCESETKGNCIERVNKDTGSSDATIELGREKEPKYAVDDVTGRIFIANGPSTIKCYQF